VTPGEKTKVSEWDERYRRGDHLDDPPMPLLVRVAETLAPGRALDIACGPGRHALFLAERGWQVTAVDASGVAIEVLKTRAQARGLNLDARVADLEKGKFKIEPDAYDLICDCYYLQRNLFPHLRAGVRPGGLVVAAIHMVDNTPGVKPMNPNFLLQSGELRSEFADWAVLHYYEGKPTEAGHQRQVAEIVARRR
jgi:SAM-dependent methyltransferase